VKSKSSGLGASILRAAAAAALLLVALEGTARVVIFGPAGLDPRRVPLIADTDVKEFVTFESEPSIGWEYAPNLDTFLKLVRLRTNSHGMRDEEYPLAKPSGTVRVAVLGSSFSLPAGVEIEDAYHSVLEERLSAEFAPRTYEFLNLAVGAHMPSQSIAMLLHRALRFDPDLVIVSATRMAIPHLLREWNQTPRPQVLDRVSSSPRSFLIELAKSRLQLLPEKVGLRSPRFPPRRGKRPDVIEKLAAISRQYGIPIVLFRIEYDAVEPSPVEREIERRVRAEGMYYVDSRSAFEGTDPRDSWIHELDPHPDARAHVVFADVLEGSLRRDGLLSHPSQSRRRTGTGATRAAAPRRRATASSAG